MPSRTDEPAAVDRAPAAATPTPPAPARANVGLRPGQRPPPFTAVDLDGHAQTIEQYKDQILLLHFWATWCPYCRREQPKLKQIVAQHGEDGVRVLAISVDDDVETVKNYVRQQPLPYPVVSEAANKVSLAELFEVMGLPTTYVIDRQGRMIGRFQGQGNLVGAVEQLLEFERTHAGGNDAAPPPPHHRQEDG